MPPRTKKAKAPKTEAVIRADERRKWADNLLFYAEAAAANRRRYARGGDQLRIRAAGTAENLFRWWAERLVSNDRDDGCDAAYYLPPDDDRPLTKTEERLCEMVDAGVFQTPWGEGGLLCVGPAESNKKFHDLPLVPGMQAELIQILSQTLYTAAELEATAEEDLRRHEQLDPART